MVVCGGRLYFWSGVFSWQQFVLHSIACINIRWVSPLLISILRNHYLLEYIKCSDFSSILSLSHFFSLFNIKCLPLFSNVFMFFSLLSLVTSSLSALLYYHSTLTPPPWYYGTLYHSCTVLSYHFSVFFLNQSLNLFVPLTFKTRCFGF